MAEAMQETINRIKPLADAVVGAATVLNAAIRSAADGGLSGRVEVLEQREPGDEEPVPVVRARISKRIA